jgi:hypothetical protein
MRLTWPPDQRTGNGWRARRIDESSSIPASADSAVDPDWTGTWSASPWSIKGQGKTFEDQTLRQIVRISP